MRASMKNSAQRLVLVVALMLGGCALASVTQYQPVGADGGYTDLQLAPDMFRVAFQGNTYTTQERVADMALLRAADLTLVHGAPYFVVINQLRESRSFPSLPYVGGPYTSYGYVYAGSAASGIVVQDYRAELAIKLLREEPGPSVSAYSASLLREELRRRYELDKR